MTKSKERRIVMFKKVILASVILNIVSCAGLTEETNSAQSTLVQSPLGKPTLEKPLLVQPEGLLTELLRWPERAVITDATPELSWEVPLAVEQQQAYRILVASSANKLALDEADMWDSTKVISTDNLNINYAGLALQPNTSYWWKVKVWDKNDNSSVFSQAQKFNTDNLGKQVDKQWPGESKWVQLDEQWISQDRQTAVFEKIQPIQTTEVEANVYLTEFENAAFATLNVTITSDKDQSITLYLGERLGDDGLINKNPGHSFIGYQKLNLAVKQGTHAYQTKVPANHSKSPHHQKLAPFYPEVLPFRFAELLLPEKGLSIDSITQYALYYPFDDNASSFKSDNDVLNQVWGLSKYTLKATPFLGVYADGNRERMPYEADAYIQQLGHYNVDREFSVARYTAKFLLHHASWPTEWHMHMLMIAWQDYMHTGNKEFLEKYYDDLKVKTLYELAREDGLISSKTPKVTPNLLKRLHYDGHKFRDIVDWPKGTKPGKKQARNAGATPEGERDGYIFTDYNTVVNAFHFNVMTIMADIAKVVGNSADQIWFKEQSLQVKASMQEHMFDKKRGVFVDGIGSEHASLHANMFALAFDLVPENNIESVLTYMQSKGMASSVYGAQHLLDGLYKAGAADYALSLMTSDSKRSWLNMIKVGSTMTTEAWDEVFKPNLTWNHAWGSAPANIIPRRLMGIEPLEAGFKRFSIVPQPSSLHHIALTVPTISGAINTGLQVSNSGNKLSWTMQITVPGNTQGELWLPVSFNDITLNDQPYTSETIKMMVNSSRKLILLPAGEYNITAQ